MVECLIRYRTAIGTSPDFYLSDGDNEYAILGIKEIGRKDKMLLTIVKKDLKDIFSS
jgi:hypothetical protein